MRLSITIAFGLLIAFGAANASDKDASKDEQKEVQIADGIHIVPKFFQPTEGNGPSSLGFAYAVRRAIATSPDKQPISDNAYRLFKFDFKAEGNVAFNSDANPADFLKTGLEMNAVYQYATAATIGGPGSKCDPTNPDTADICREEAKRSKAGDAATVLAGFIGSYETNRRFDKKNWTYGTHVTTVYTPAPGSFFNAANPLDWPFRMLRSVTGHPWGSTASPDAFPKLRLAIERVQPKEDKDRQAIVGSSKDFNRANLEVAMTTPVGVLKGQQVKFDWSWRYFREIHPETAIRAAGLDRSRYTASTLRLDSGWQLTYASGRLPLDRANDKAWELGYRFKFD